MFGKDTPDLVVMVITVGVATALNRSGTKSKVIQDYKELNEVQRLKIEELEAEKKELQETVDGYTKLVREGYLAGGNRQGRGDGSTHPKTTKNRGTR